MQKQLTNIWLHSPLQSIAICIGVMALAITSLAVQTTSPNGMAILPILDWISKSQGTPADEAYLQNEMTRLKAQIGENHDRFRIGFSHILVTEKSLLMHCRLAQRNNLSVGVIIAVQTHTGLGTGIVDHDFRCMQWRMDGKTWRGEQATGKEQVEFPARDWEVPTPSRYCDAIHDAAMAKAKTKAEMIRRAMDQFPGVIVVVNATIEEELATSGAAHDGLLADYSPFAVAEFRDWLRHTGKYDDTTGEYAGEGAPPDITGPLVPIHGTLRSPFYDDPTPNDSHGTGKSFNERFATNFSTWTLRSWDLDQFPAPITNEKFSPMPASGTGFTAGGFDAPRKRDVKNKYWCAWSWDVADHGGKYPPGNPQHPAFGFRQMEIKHFVSDVLNVARKSGVPANMLYAHQIPGEMVEASRSRSGADPIWAGYYEPAQTLGITRFGPAKVDLINQYSQNWGIFEWHPKPFSKRNDPALYRATMNALNSYSQHGCRILFPGWWNPDAEGHRIFPLDDSQFARALHDWLTTQCQRK